MIAFFDVARGPVTGPVANRRPTGSRSGLTPTAALVISLQRSAGNRAVADVIALQRCGPTPCGCSDEERADHADNHPAQAVAAVQRTPDHAQAGLTDPAAGTPQTRQEARAGLIAQIASARQRLGSQESLDLPDGRLAKLNRQVEGLNSASGGLIGIAPLPVAGGTAADEVTTVRAADVDALLAGLQAALSVGAAPTAAQRNVQRLLDPATAAALVAAELAATATAEAGAPVAAVAAPETGGISLAVLGIAALVVGGVTAAIVYATYKPSTAAVPGAPVMPEGLSREAKQKWRECVALHDAYESGSKKRVKDLGGEMAKPMDDFNNNRLTPEQKRRLCAMVHEQLSNVERLIVERNAYIDAGCDQIHWFPNDGTTAAERERAHREEVNHVKAQQSNLRTLLSRLQAQGAC